MKEITGFKGQVYIDSWKDQLYSTRFWVLISDGHSIKPSTDYIHEIRQYASNKPLGEARCMEMGGGADSVFGHEVFLIFQEGNTIPAIVHECVHAKNYVFQFHGILIDTENDEHEAYFVDYLVRNVLAVFEDRKNKIALNLKKKKEYDRRDRNKRKPKK